MTYRKCRQGLGLLGVVMLLAACSGGDEAANADAPAGTPAATNVPVQVATVRTKDLDIVVTAPGQTEALRRDRIRAPYASRLLSLRVGDGDRVSKGQVIAVIVSKDSDAALAGAKQMLSAAKTAADKLDAERAVEVAGRNLVEQALTAPADGVILSHAAESGDYIDVNEVLVTVAETATVYFNAEVAQSEVDGVQPGQSASIDMPAKGKAPLGARVSGLLPMASSQNFSAPVRLDFSPARPDVPLGLFGTAHIVIGEHRNATVVPARAVLQDDVTGRTRVAVVGAGDIAHWLTVEVGLREGDEVEIVKPEIAAGTRVITDGQVGLPEGARVAAE